MISVQELSKRFPLPGGGSVLAVNRLSFQVQPGEVYGLLGPNGAGKTTTLRMVLGLLRPTSGQASIAGFGSSQHPDEVKRRVGLVAADAGLYPGLTVREMLLFFADLYAVPNEQAERELARLSQLLGLHDILDRRCATSAPDNGSAVTLARRLIHRPPVMLLDEPTLGLDVLASQIIIEYIELLRREGKAVILTTHHLDDAERLCTRFRLMHLGELVSEGTLGELRERTGCRNLIDMFLKLSKVGPALAQGVMNEAHENEPPRAAHSVLGRVFRLARKELREILRDRRTIVTMIAMPILLYPLHERGLSAVLAGQQDHDGVRSCLQCRRVDRERARSVRPSPRIGTGSITASQQKSRAGPPRKKARRNTEAPQFFYYTKSKRAAANDREREAYLAELKEQLQAKEPDAKLDLIVVIDNLDAEDVGQNGPAKDRMLPCKIYALPNNGAAQSALNYIGIVFAAIDAENLKERLNKPGVTPKAVVLSVRPVFLESAGPEGLLSLAARRATHLDPDDDHGSGLSGHRYDGGRAQSAARWRF